MDSPNSLALLFLSLKVQSRMRRQLNGYPEEDLEARGEIGTAVTKVFETFFGSL